MDVTICERESFNLFTKYGRRNFFKRGILGDKLARKCALKDMISYIKHTIRKYFYRIRKR